MKYPQIYKDDLIEPAMRGWKMACCDCGLVHRFRFHLIKNGKGTRSIRFRISRDNRATAAVRRKKQVKR